jgi:ribosomal protein L11 methyltransferase
LVRLAVRCPPEHAERVLAELLELVPGGVEEDRGATYVEFAIYGAPGELPALPDLDGVAGEGVVEVRSSEIPDDWADRWRDFHGPVTIGDRLTIRPSWLEAEGEDADEAIEVIVDPGRAFGTGAHATTRLCLELLLDAPEGATPRGPLADWGTGSGVLAIAAAKLGYSPVVACDHERAALDAAEANAAANAVELELVRINLREEAPPLAPTVTANLTAPVLVAIADRLAAAPGGEPNVLICSGALVPEADAVVAAFARCGLGERRRRGDGEWVALALAR